MTAQKKASASQERAPRTWRDRVLGVVVPLLQQLLLPVGAILLSFLIGAIFILIIGKNPIAAYAALIQGPFGDVYSLGETLENETPLILT